MTPAKFRELALGLPEAVESAHMGHPDFRVGGRIFATLGYPDEQHAVVGLSPEEQRKLVETRPDIFGPAAGAWGRRGSTQVLLAKAREAEVRRGLAQAWRKVAPKKLLARMGAE
ncbi:MAG: MmcQ/YjbR family DNA-binding protein [Chthoniobacterales bacterium]